MLNEPSWSWKRQSFPYAFTVTHCVCSTTTAAAAITTIATTSYTISPYIIYRGSILCKRTTHNITLLFV